MSETATISSAANDPATAMPTRGPTRETERRSDDSPSAAMAAIVNQPAINLAALAATSGMMPNERSAASSTKPMTNHGTNVVIERVGEANASPAAPRRRMAK